MRSHFTFRKKCVVAGLMSIVSLGAFLCPGLFGNPVWVSGWDIYSCNTSISIEAFTHAGEDYNGDSDGASSSEPGTLGHMSATSNSSSPDGASSSAGGGTSCTVCVGSVGICDYDIAGGMSATRGTESNSGGMITGTGIFDGSAQLVGLSGVDYAPWRFDAGAIWTASGPGSNEMSITASLTTSEIQIYWYDNAITVVVDGNQTTTFGDSMSGNSGAVLASTGIVQVEIGEYLSYNADVWYRTGVGNPESGTNTRTADFTLELVGRYIP